VSLKDTQAASQALTQKMLLDEFVQRFFHGEDGTLIAAFQPLKTRRTSRPGWKIISAN